MLNTPTLIDGKAIAQKTHAASRVAAAELRARGFTPGLAVVLVGDDPASRAYVRAKDKMCLELGMHSIKHELPATTSQADLIAIVRQLNAEGISILLVEQAARMALKLAHRGYVMETGQITISGTASELLADKRVQDAYLGG